MRVPRRVMGMSDPELRAVLAVVVPGRRVENLPTHDMQEMCIKWLFGNGLSMNHEFFLDKDEDGTLFVVMSPNRACSCCKKEGDTVSVADFDRSPIGSSLAVYRKDDDDDMITLTVPTNDERCLLLPPPTLYQELVRRNSSASTNKMKTDPPVIHYQRTNSEGTIKVNGVRKCDDDTPPPYAPPPPPGQSRPLYDRRGQKISPVRTQPLPQDNKRYKKPDDDDDEKNKGFFRSCYREFGSCCMGLCSNFSL